MGQTLKHDLLTRLREGFAARDGASGAYVIGVAGGVAAGKTTFAEMLRDEMAQWPEKPAVEIISTDGFLFSNKVLAEQKLSTRKGFPESYNVTALRAALAGLRGGARVSVPLYSHATYDIDHEASQTIEHADIAIVDGLHLGRVKHNESRRRLIQVLIYLDADEADIEHWFRDRLLALMRAGRTDPNSFYHAFRQMDDAAALDFVQRVWNGINLPNLREHIVRDRDAADVVVKKAGDHTVKAVEWRIANNSE
jgi:type I pantothenate kinase